MNAFKIKSCGHIVTGYSNVQNEKFSKLVNFLKYKKKSDVKININFINVLEKGSFFFKKNTLFLLFLNILLMTFKA